MATSTSCMNPLCGTSSSSSGSKKGWILRSGDYAILCDTCGSAYEQSSFCDVFHSNDSGWRQCTLCGKRLHCGCSASRFMVELLDYGGVNCINCFKSSGVNTSLSVNNHVNGEQKIMQLGNITQGNGQRNLLQLHNDERLVSFSKMKQEDAFHSAADIGSSSFSQFRQATNGFHQTPKPDGSRLATAVKDSCEPLLQTNLSITLGSSALGNPNPFTIAAIDERRQSKASSSLPQWPKSHHLLPKPMKSTLSTSLEANTNMVSQIRVARPPAEGRGRNQLLPRYWPRITDQELQQLCGDSNSTIVPLFEKVLSASDAGRIGRLVLPKACAEAYFPPISQPEGLPLRIQDVKGKEWVFQFRFWPNNNSRMYVLEGVTPCIQSMQLQAGDTVTFSRMDPEGKLVMGFRKASNSVSVQPLKGSNDTHLHALSKHLHPAPGDINWYRSEKYDDGSREALLSSLLTPERKRMRNIGSQSKRLLVDSMDAKEIKLTWEEAQDLLRPPPSVKPSVMTIEDHDFEEYEEPPVFGKSGIYVVQPSGGPEQWVQCDSCCKWRRLPADVLLPPKWTCMDNVWDEKRCSCSAPDELTPRELESLLIQNKDLQKRRTASSQRPVQDHESSGLESLAKGAMLGEVGDQDTTTIATTTKHPRHRPGCSCIVCIQPPSGKGKHKPTCTCKICMTVKRRFKTLMMRKRKRQSEHEAEIAQRNQPLWGFKDEAEVQSNSKNLSPNQDPSENEATNELESKSQGNNQLKADSNIDLNHRPDSEDVSRMGLNQTSMMGLLQVAGLPLETYLKQNGLTSLVSEQQTSSTMHVSPQTGESEGQTRENQQFTSPVQEQESSHEEDEAPAPEESRADPA